jgi:hypothetical protein
MDTNLLLNRLQTIQPSLTKTGLIEAVSDGNRLLVQTAEQATQRSRLFVRIGSGLGMLAGLILACFSPWGWAVSLFCLLVLLLAPRFIASRLYLEIDPVGKQLILLQNTGAEVNSVSLTDVLELQGVYETKGWDPYSVIYARLRDGSKVPILLLIGGSDTKAAEACVLLGSLLNCPATYQGPFGDKLSCYIPASAD